jgi:hypothetical protein
MGKKATAFLLDEETIPEIAKLSGIEEEVLKGWFLHDQSWSLQTKVIVVEIAEDNPDEKESDE